jgi:hypothetical protein
MDAALLAKLEAEHGLQPGLLKAVMMQESGGDPNAVSKAGAKGWFQFMPDTAKEYGVTDPTDFTQSATGAAKYLSRLQSKFGNIEDTLRAYNWGQGNLRAYQKGKRTDMPTEAAEYPQRVLARLEGGDAPPEFETDDPPEFELPPDVMHPALKSAGPVKDWQAELKNAPGTSLLPLVGGVGGSMIGAAAGAPTVVGAIPGAAAGGTLGAIMGHALAIRNHEAPVEEKLKYLVGAFNMEALMNMAGTKGIQAIQNVLARTPKDRAAIVDWFRKNGSEINPEVYDMSGRATRVYKSAEDDMATTIDESLGSTMRSLNQGGTPTDMGVVFQTAYKDAVEKVGQSHETLFAPFKHGTTVGNSLTVPTTSLRDTAKEVLQQFKDIKSTNKQAGAGADVVAIVKDLASGKAAPLATLVAQKRALGNTANWDAVQGGVDNSIRMKLYKELDGAIEAQLAKTNPAMLAQWNTANATANRQLGILTDTMIKKMAADEKVNPMLVTEFVAKNASPSAVTAYKKALGLMQAKGSITKEQNVYLMDHVRRNWIELNMSDSKKAAQMYDSILGSGKNAEAVDAFNAVFSGSPYRTVLEETARAAHALRQYGARIPASSGSSGEYVTGMSLGGLAGGMVAGPGGAAAGSTLAGALVFLTNAVPKAMAKAQLRNDHAVRNQIRYVSNWLNQASPSDLKSVAAGNFSTMPANVYRAYNAVEAYSNE